MAERRGTDELDEAVNALMADAQAPLPRLHPRLAALLRIATDLRDLPAEVFKARLRAELLSGRRGAGEPAASAPSGGGTLAAPEGHPAPAAGAGGRARSGR